MNYTTSPTITEAQVKDFLASLLARVSPDGRTGFVSACYSLQWWQIACSETPSVSFSFNGHGMPLQMASTADELAKAVAENTPASKALRRREELLKELAQLDAAQTREVQP